MVTASNSKPEFKRWVYPVAAAGFLGFLLYILFFINVGDVVSVLKTANSTFIVLALTCVLVSVAFNALSWHYILKGISVRTGYRKVFSLSLVGNFVDAIVPGGWAGDIFKAYLLAKDGNGIGAKTASSIVIKNVLELVVTLGALISGIFLLALNYTLEGGILLAVGAAMFLLCLPITIIIYLSTNLAATQSVFRGFRRVVARIKGKQTEPSKLESRLQNQLQEFHEGVMTLKTNPRSMAKPMIFQTLSWVFDILVLCSVFAALGQIVGPDKLVITNSLVVGLQTQGVAFSGFVQVVSSSVYTILGISPLLAIASSLLAGLSSFWFKMGVSFVAFQRAMFSRRIPIAGSNPVQTELALQLPAVNAEPNVG